MEKKNLEKIINPSQLLNNIKYYTALTLAVTAPFIYQPNVYPYINPNIDPITETKTEDVSGRSLPYGVLGIHQDGKTKTTQISTDLPAKDRAYVKAHEFAHSLGIHDEKRADDIATYLTGRSDMNRFYKYLPTNFYG